MAAALTTQCCIAGGGPAGMMLGVLLARAGVEATVLEKHSDFLRDFRGDTVHPSTLEVLYELGWLDAFLQRPHQKVEEIAAYVAGQRVPVADLRHLPTRCKFVALMPQWDFLDFVAEQGRRYPGFHLVMEAEVDALIESGGAVAGVRARTPSGPLEVRASLTVGADGRHSTVRSLAALPRRELGAPMDILWMRLRRRSDDPAQVLGYTSQGHILVMIYRGDYWQCGLVIAKGGADALRAQGLEPFRQRLLGVAPWLGEERVQELQSWDEVKLLTVAVDRVEQWHRPGLLVIGDAAHAMSPVGGVGINLAVQDAVAAANLLAAPLAAGTLAARDLERVARRRAWPTRATQAAQVAIQNRVIGRVLGGEAMPANARLPLPLRLLQRWPWLRRLPARAVGLGVRPEHWRGN
ncbi:MAG: FAD-dependent oxidoreductase [Terriglobales bacterium]